jgi:hypothetical protein
MSCQGKRHIYVKQQWPNSSTMLLPTGKRFKRRVTSRYPKLLLISTLFIAARTSDPGAPFTLPSPPHLPSSVSALPFAGQRGPCETLSHGPECARARRPAFIRPTVKYNSSFRAFPLHPCFVVKWAQRVRPALWCLEPRWRPILAGRRPMLSRVIALSRVLIDCIIAIVTVLCHNTSQPYRYGRRLLRQSSTVSL